MRFDSMPSTAAVIGQASRVLRLGKWHVDGMWLRQVVWSSMKRNVIVCVVVFVACGVLAQLGGPGGFERSPMSAPEGEVSYGPIDTISRDRKARSWWRRPKYDSPARQLAHAKQREQAGDTKEAVRAYDAVVHQWHDSDEGVVAQMAMADLLFAMGKLEKSFASYQYLVDHYPGSFSLSRVVSQQLAVAEAMLAKHTDGTGWGTMFDSPETVLPMLERIVKNAPQWAQTPGVRFARARLLEQLEEYVDAVDAYELLEQLHPRAPEAALGAYRRVVCLMVLADDNPRDKKLGRRALSVCERYLSRYPDSEGVADARERAVVMRKRLGQMAYREATYYDEIARRPAAAIVAYKQFLEEFPFTPMADAARARLAELEAAIGGVSIELNQTAESGAEE